MYTGSGDLWLKFQLHYFTRTNSKIRIVYNLSLPYK
jgi:hypothetical protein